MFREFFRKTSFFQLEVPTRVLKTRLKRDSSGLKRRLKIRLKLDSSGLKARLKIRLIDSKR